jgi:hypothetical protein
VPDVPVDESGVPVVPVVVVLPVVSVVVVLELPIVSVAAIF